jgi:hypothetical protein
LCGETKNVGKVGVEWGTVMNFVKYREREKKWIGKEKMGIVEKMERMETMKKMEIMGKVEIVEKLEKLGKLEENRMEERMEKGEGDGNRICLKRNKVCLLVDDEKEVGLEWDLWTHVVNIKY